MKKSLSSSYPGSILLRRSARQSPPLEANVNWNVLRRKLLVVTVGIGEIEGGCHSEEEADAMAVEDKWFLLAAKSRYGGD
jgi:hypothetical protein